MRPAVPTSTRSHAGRRHSALAVPASVVLVQRSSWSTEAREDQSLDGGCTCTTTRPPHLAPGRPCGAGQRSMREAEEPVSNGDQSPVADCCPRAGTTFDTRTGGRYADVADGTG